MKKNSTGTTYVPTFRTSESRSSSWNKLSVFYNRFLPIVGLQCKTRYDVKIVTCLLLICFTLLIPILVIPALACFQSAQKDKKGGRK